MNLLIMSKDVGSFCLRLMSLTIFVTLTNCDKGTDEENSKSKLWRGSSQEFEQTFEKVTDSDNANVLVELKSKQKFDGIIETNSSGMQINQKYRNGKLDGKSTNTSTDGSKVEAVYKNGVLHGDMILYDSNGKVRSVITYENGKVK